MIIIIIFILSLQIWSCASNMDILTYKNEIQSKRSEIQEALNKQDFEAAAILKKQIEEINQKIESLEQSNSLDNDLSDLSSLDSSILSAASYATKSNEIQNVYKHHEYHLNMTTLLVMKFLKIAAAEGVDIVAFTSISGSFQVLFDNSFCFSETNVEKLESRILYHQNLINENKDKLSNLMKENKDVLPNLIEVKRERLRNEGNNRLSIPSQDRIKQLETENSNIQHVIDSAIKSKNISLLLSISLLESANIVFKNPKLFRLLIWKLLQLKLNIGNASFNEPEPLLLIEYFA